MEILQEHTAEQRRSEGVNKGSGRMWMRNERDEEEKEEEVVIETEAGRLPEGS